VWVVVRKRVAVVVANLKWNLASRALDKPGVRRSSKLTPEGATLACAISALRGRDPRGLRFVPVFTTRTGQKSLYRSQSRANLSASHWRSRSRLGLAT
jgi:hypothetical protein